MFIINQHFKNRYLSQTSSVTVVISPLAGPMSDGVVGSISGGLT
ncbi:hypothetical protein HanPSC8_Chr07g0300291 [Helianthus annuus]|nr:hypothetical protein HanPSC8_Chr07g0300291 [Helianthus annuus]